MIEWVRDGKLFDLPSFGITDPESLEISYKDPRGFILFSYNGSDVKVLRANSKSQIKRKAALLASRTMGPVYIGRQIGEKNQHPVFKLVASIPVQKQDALSLEMFERWLDSLTNKLDKTYKPEQERLYKVSVKTLSFDYQEASSEAIGNAIETLQGEISSPRASILRAQQVDISRFLRNVLTRTGVSASEIPRIKASLAAGFEIKDRLVAELLAQHHMFWARDQHGRISESISAQSRRIISDGVSRGLGNREIAEQLRSQIRGGLNQRGYWQVVASNHIARARSYSLGSSMRAAGIGYYRIEAVLDFRTTHQ